MISAAWVDSAMTSWPVIPSATDPRATKRGISDAGRKTLLVSLASRVDEEAYRAMGWFCTRATSRRWARLYLISAPVDQHMLHAKQNPVQGRRRSSSTCSTASADIDSPERSSTHFSCNLPFLGTANNNLSFKLSTNKLIVLSAPKLDFEARLVSSVENFAGKMGVCTWDLSSVSWDDWPFCSAIFVTSIGD